MNAASCLTSPMIMPAGAAGKTFLQMAATARQRHGEATESPCAIHNNLARGGAATHCGKQSVMPHLRWAIYICTVWSREVKAMGVRGEARRQKIVEAAVDVFREQGFERASMAEIAARAGGSKATLYW